MAYPTRTRRPNPNLRWMTKSIPVADGRLVWSESRDALGRPLYREPALNGRDITVAEFKELLLLEGITRLLS